MSYQPDQFDKCHFNPLAKSLLKTYPRLTDLLPVLEPSEESKADPLQDEGEPLLRYVLALYDPKSPLTKDYPDLSSRKLVAADLAGYDLKKDAEKLTAIYACDSEYMVGLIVNFLRQVVQSRLWASIQADEQVFWEFVARLFKPITEDSDKDGVNAIEKKIKLSQGRETISAQIDVNNSKFLGDDEDLKKKVKKRLDYSPESMAGIK